MRAEPYPLTAPLSSLGSVLQGSVVFHMNLVSAELVYHIKPPTSSRYVLLLTIRQNKSEMTRPRGRTLHDADECRRNQREQRQRRACFPRADVWMTGDVRTRF